MPPHSRNPPSQARNERQKRARDTEKAASQQIGTDPSQAPKNRNPAVIRRSTPPSLLISVEHPFVPTDGGGLVKPCASQYGPSSAWLLPPNTLYSTAAEEKDAQAEVDDALWTSTVGELAAQAINNPTLLPQMRAALDEVEKAQQGAEPVPHSGYTREETDQAIAVMKEQWVQEKNQRLAQPAESSQTEAQPGDEGDEQLLFFSHVVFTLLNDVATLYNQNGTLAAENMQAHKRNLLLIQNVKKLMRENRLMQEHMQRLEMESAVDVEAVLKMVEQEMLNREADRLRADEEVAEIRGECRRAMESADEKYFDAENAQKSAITKAADFERKSQVLGVKLAKLGEREKALEEREGIFKRTKEAQDREIKEQEVRMNAWYAAQQAQPRLEAECAERMADVEAEEQRIKNASDELQTKQREWEAGQQRRKETETLYEKRATEMHDNASEVSRKLEDVRKREDALRNEEKRIRESIIIANRQRDEEVAAAKDTEEKMQELGERWGKMEVWQKQLVAEKAGVELGASVNAAMRARYAGLYEEMGKLLAETKR